MWDNIIANLRQFNDLGLGLIALISGVIALWAFGMLSKSSQSNGSNFVGVVAGFVCACSVFLIFTN